MEFLELILFLVHVMAGQPGRGMEITAIRYANSMNAHRNIFIYDGQVMILTQYHKSIVITDQLKVIPRFLPPCVGQMWTVYLTHILPYHYNPVTEPFSTSIIWWFRGADHCGDARHHILAVTEPPWLLLNPTGPNYNYSRN